jgi:cysteine desulfurase family protein (TIGR01976 family)
MPIELDVAACRGQFPALHRQFDGRPAVFLDGPAGTQVPQRVIDAMTRYLVEHNANHGGVFATSQESDTMLAAAHRAAADLCGTPDADLVAFGPNMTTLTLGLSRALAHTWKPGDRILLSRLDHDANVTPWALAARDAGVEVDMIDVDPRDCTLDMEDLRKKLARGPRLVAVGCASNAVGTLNPVEEITRASHDAGALVFLDAVHYAPHGLMDVARWDCDFLACSSYKFFGPHVGILHGRRELMTSLPAYKVRPAPDHLPDRWMTGTQSHEGIAGTLEAIEYLADLGRALDPQAATRRDALTAAMAGIVQYEQSMCRRLLEGLAALVHVKVWGIADPARVEDRVPTVSITHDRMSPRRLAESLAQRGIFAWHGNYYALPLTEALDLEPQGMVRLGFVHYNTMEEVQRLLDALADLDRA